MIGPFYVNTDARRRMAWGPPCSPEFASIRIDGRTFKIERMVARAFEVWEQARIRYAYHLEGPDTGFYNCFAGDTRIITRDGLAPIKELWGQTVPLLSTKTPPATVGAGGAGRWVEAPVQHFGEDEIVEVAMERSGVRKVVGTTADHRWFIKNRSRWRLERTTMELRPGDKLATVAPQTHCEIVSPVGIIAGLVFGDGTVDKFASRLLLIGQTLQFENLVRPLARDYGKGSPSELRSILFGGLPRSWKAAPLFDEGPSYLAGWLAGYVAADGTVTRQGIVKLASAQVEHLEIARAVATRLGIRSGSITSNSRLGYGTSESLIYELGFERHSAWSDLLIRDDHRDRFMAVGFSKSWARWRVVGVERTGRIEDVFCPQVPGSESFSLDGFILTGNCRRMRHSASLPYSPHAWATALDVNWLENPAGSKLISNIPRQMVFLLQSVKTTSGAYVFMWGGDWDRNVRTGHTYYDAMHWEVIAHPLDLNTGITLPGFPTPPPTIPVGDDDVPLKVGDRGNAVKVVQRNLNLWQPALSLLDDGIYGDNTGAAVRIYQEAANLPQTSQVDGTTAAFITTIPIRLPK